MFANQQKFVIHPMNKPCIDELSTSDQQHYSNNIENLIANFLSISYPKNKVLHLVFSILVKQKLINDELFFIDFSTVHVADFCAFINNRFGKKDKTDVNMLKLCKFLQSKSIKLPRVSLKNPVAQKYFT